MTGESGEALELALGLLRAPGLRSTLRRRALPAGITEVLTIASGSSDATREAAARTGRTEAELVEASRFYIQQVLLTDGADVYRNLGAPPDAPHDLLRDHHRLLLRWLHPDRSRDGAQWDSALSIRVNQAWNQVRTPAVRARYDAEQSRPEAAAPGAATAATPASTAALARTVPYVAVDPPKPPATGPIAVACLTVACVALAWLAVTREQRLDQLRDANRFPAQAMDLSERMAAPLPLVLPEVDVRAAAPADSQVTSEAPPAAEPPLDPAPVEPPQWADATPDNRDAVPSARTTPTSAAHAPVPVDNRLAAPRAPAVEVPRVEDPLQLFREAETALEGLTHWLASGQGGEPLWLDLPVSLAAAGVRDELHGRHAASTRNQLAVMHPDWTLGTASASISGAYRLDGRSGTLETGVLRVQLARRGEHWRVARLYMEPAQ